MEHTFGIKIKENKKRKPCLGEIKINNFKESFIMSLNDWTMEDYKKQWQAGIDRLKHANSSTLIANAQGLKHLSFEKEIFPLIEWWILYKVDNKVYIQNKLMCDVIYKKIVGKKPFNAQTCYQFITPRNTHTSEGYEIDEWVMDLDDILAFDPMKKE